MGICSWWVNEVGSYDNDNCNRMVANENCAADNLTKTKMVRKIDNDDYPTWRYESENLSFKLPKIVASTSGFSIKPQIASFSHLANRQNRT